MTAPFLLLLIPMRDVIYCAGSRARGLENTKDVNQILKLVTNVDKTLVVWWGVGSLRREGGGMDKHFQKSWVQ